MKKWFLERFLPMWAKETVLSDNRALRAKNAALEEQVRQLESYIRGMRAGLRAVRKRRAVTEEDRNGHLSV